MPPALSQRDRGRAVSTTQPTSEWEPLQVLGNPHGLVGSLIAIEGVDAAGKTTQIDRLVTALAMASTTAIVVRHPSDSLRRYYYWRAWADENSGVPLSAIDGFGLSILALGDRLVQQTAVVQPTLAAGGIVICDRYQLSSLVYESSPAHAYCLARLLRPDIAILLTASAPTILARLRSRTSEREHRRDEREKPILIEQYKQLAKLNGYHIFDTDSCDEQDTASSIASLVDQSKILPLVAE